MDPIPLDPQTPQDPIVSWWKQVHFGEHGLDSFKTALAAALCLVLGRLFGLEHTYWAAISAIVVTGSDAGVTFSSCLDRIIGTAIGALIGWATAYFWHGHALLYGLAVAVCVLVCSALQFHKAGHLAAVALTMVLLANIDATPGHAALNRFLEVGLGIVVALAVTLAVSPRKAIKTVVKRGATNQR
jgi:uncharacterized membrane protein YccC